MPDERLGRGVLFFDGAMGSMLQSRGGLKLRELPESLNLTHPDLIRSIHEDYLRAGADFITTNTFGANRFKLRDTGLDVARTVGAAVGIAHRAADSAGGIGGPSKRVALDIGPTGRVMAPLGDASFDEVYDAVAEQVQAALQAGPGPDVVLLETFTDLYELKAAVLAVKEACGLPILATMSFEEDGHTFFGASVEAMVLTLEGLGVSALGVNCSLGPRQLLPIVERIVAASHVPVMVQPNAGLPVMREGVASYDVSPQEFADFAARFAEMGAAVLGGCCGTTPEHIARMVQAVGHRPVSLRPVPHRTAVCSPSRTVFFDDDFVIVGERLNPTGKKGLQAALRAEDMDTLVREALKQQDQGAHVLDVNVGLPDIDETRILCRAVREIQAVVDLPLQLDSSSAEALDAAARAYNGKPLLNSVSGKAASLEAVLPVAKKYGACILGLTLDDGGIPDRAERRLEVAARIVQEAERAGIPRRDVLIDCLTLTASAQQDLVWETLRAVRMVREELGVRTILGVSNVSFGLPRRGLVNRTFFTAALAQGLDAAIMNPGDLGMREALAAWRLLRGRDRGARDYLDFCERNPEAAPPSKAGSAPQGGSEQGEAGKEGLQAAIARGLREDAAARTRELLKEVSPQDVIQQHIVPALDAVGQEYEAKRLFLPQLIKAAEAAGAAFDQIKEALTDGGQGEGQRGPIAIATVYGDVHDIGKNIVKVLLENYHFRVVDLGKDVPPEQVIAAVKGGIRVVGLSALMTTTVASMKDTIERLRRECPEVKVIVGGAVLTPDLARYVGADFYARDAMEGVRIASELCP